MKQQVIINAGVITISVQDGRCVPASSKLLQIVGLSPLSEELDRLYDFLSDYNEEGLIKWTAYMCDLRRVEAKKRLLRYFVLEMGVRIIWDETEQGKTDDWDIGVDHIRTLLNDFISIEDIQKELEKEGFYITIIKNTHTLNNF